MSKLKIEHGISKTERIKLQVSIDQAISDDVDLMAKWSDNEKNYIVNELLRFALGESAEFQQHKLSLRNASLSRHPGSEAKIVATGPALNLRASEAAR